MIPAAEENTPFPGQPGGPADSVGARRVRHAFRFAVLACVATTFTLWFAEIYLRYPKPERLYRMALLHEDDSARALLRNLVPKEGQVPQDPRYGTYLAALAFIEDGAWERERQGVYESYAVDPLVIERYEQALSADKENPFILMMYGCALFLDGQYTRARDLFRDTRRFTEPEDALPVYLEAAARAQLGEMQEALSLIRQTNSNPAMRIRTPEPLWHATLPRQGTWYAKMQRRLTERTLAPLVKLKELVCDRADRRAGDAHPARSASKGSDTQQAPFDADAWLREVETLGVRLLGLPRVAEGASAAADATPATTLQARMGVQFQQDAIRLRMQRLSQPAAERDVATRKLAALEDAQAQLQAFDDQREERIRKHAAVVNRPGLLCFQTFALLLVVYLFVYMTAKGMHAGRMAWAVPHPSWALAALASVCGLLFVILIAFLLLQRITAQPGIWLETLTYVWYALVGLALTAGIVYPRLLCPGAKSRGALEDASTTNTDPTRPALAGQPYARVYVSILRRYYGVLAAAFIMLLCGYTIAHRLLLGLYPFIQAKLIISGLQNEELDLLQHIQTLLQGALL